MYGDRRIPSPDQRGSLTGAAPLLAAGRETRGPEATARSERCCSAKRSPSSSPRAASRRWSPTAARTAAPRSRWARSRASRSSAPTTAGSGRAKTEPAPASPRWPTRARSPPAPASRPFRRACSGAWSGQSLEEPLGEPPDLPWFDAETWTWGHGTPFELPVGLGRDDRELPRRRPLRLRPPRRPSARCRRWSSRSRSSETASR